MNKEPTSAQVKEFWEWCGFIWIEKDELPCFSKMWIYPDGTKHRKTPPIDPNNLFKYAVPKFDYFEMHGGNKKLAPHPLTTVEIEDFSKGKEYWGEDKDPTLALFWAIYEVIKEIKSCTS